MKFIKANWLIIVVVFLFGGNLLQYMNPIVKVNEIIKRDTVKVVTVDSIALKRAKAELNYLRKQKGKITYITKKDTQFVKGDTVYKYFNPSFIARLDTTFQKDDSLSVAYQYPDNEFNLYYKYPSTSEKITIIKETKKMFEFSHGIIAGPFITPDGTIRIGIGYGFKLGLNL